MSTFPQSDKPAFTVAEVAALMGYSRQTITDMFENEPGVIVRRGVKRRSLRIPRAAYQRVLGRLSK
jgi:hypothetical protein